MNWCPTNRGPCYPVNGKGMNHRKDLMVRHGIRSRGILQCLNTVLTAIFSLFEKGSTFLSRYVRNLYSLALVNEIVARSFARLQSPLFLPRLESFFFV